MTNSKTRLKSRYTHFHHKRDHFVSDCTMFRSRGLRITQGSRLLQSLVHKPAIQTSILRFYTTPTQGSTKRPATSLFNTTKSLHDPKSPSVTITNRKYSEQGQLLTLDITPRAIAKLTALKASEDNPDLALRVSVESGGCHGFQYNLNLSDMKTVGEDDCVFEKGGASVIIDEASLAVLKESKVDYTTELIGSMFKIVESPYMVSSCGCGSSFDLDFDKLG